MRWFVYYLLWHPGQCQMSNADIIVAISYGPILGMACFGSGWENDDAARWLMLT